MKKYITIAALLAAGTSFSNAETLTLTSPSGGALSSGNQPLAWAESYNSLMSWELSFSLTDSSLADAVLFGTRQNGGASQFCLRVLSDGALELYTYKSSHNASVGRTDAGWITAGSETNITLGFVADVNTEDSIVGGTFTLSSGADKSTSFVLGDDFSSILSNTSLLKGSGSRLYTNGGAEIFKNISISKLDNNVIPEPSAFGLISGVGALALVASRRRRK